MLFSVLQFFAHDFSCSHFFPSQSQPSMSSGDTVRLQWWYNSTTSVDVTIYTNMFTWSASCSFNMDAFVLQQNSMRLSESNTLHYKVISQLKIIYYVPLFFRKSFASLKEDNAPSVDTVEQKKTCPAMTQYSGPPSIGEGMETGVWACISQRGPSTLYPVNDSKKLLVRKSDMISESTVSKTLIHHCFEWRSMGLFFYCIYCNAK